MPDHIIVLGEPHLRSVLREYAAFHNAGRAHQGIEQRLPIPPKQAVCAATGKVIAIPILGGLHHDYRRAA